MEARYEIKAGDFHNRSELCDGMHTGLECTPHMHKHIEFFMLYAGRTTAFIDSEEYDVRAGDLCMVFPNQIHQFKTVENEKYDLFIISPDILPELESVFSQCVPESAILRAKDVGSKPKELLRELIKVNKGSGEYKNILMKGILLSFFGEVLEKMSLTDVKSVSSHALKTVINYCSKNFSRDLSLAVLEDELHISKYYISHLFSMKLKVRFNDYINSLRISDACRRLKQTDQTITEISECVGFNTLRTFNRAFIRQVGISPSEYRRINPDRVKSVSII